MRIFPERIGTHGPSLVRTNIFWTLNGFFLEECWKFRSLEASSHFCGEYGLPFKKRFMRNLRLLGARRQRKEVRPLQRKTCKLPSYLSRNAKPETQDHPSTCGRSTAICYRRRPAHTNGAAKIWYFSAAGSRISFFSTSLRRPFARTFVIADTKVRTSIQVTSQRVNYDFAGFSRL
jgi:hypothetical protein